MKATSGRPRRSKSRLAAEKRVSDAQAAEALEVGCLGEAQLRALLRFGKLALQHNDAERLMRAVGGQLVEALRADVAEIWLLHGPGRDLQLRHSFGWPEGGPQLLRSAVGPESQAGFTVQCATVVRVDDYVRETRFFGSHRLRERGMTSGLSALVSLDGQPHGALCVYSRQRRQFQDSDVQFIQAVAAVLAVGAEWQRTQEDLRDNQRRLLAGIVRDMVERREVETALRRTEERYRALQLQHTELERVAVAGELAAIVAHEVRTPLNALSINVQMLERALRRGKADDLGRARGLVGTLREEIDRINDLLQDYLQVLRRPPQRANEAFSLGQAVEDAIRFVEPKATSCDVTFEVKLSAAIQTLHGDEDRLRQVLLNVFLNAIQAMPDGGMVEVHTELRDAMVCLDVCDTGPGIEAADAERIFQPFVTTKPHGTGLGLAISDRLIRQMGGTIQAKSRAGRGACFEIRLPISQEDRAEI